MSAKKRSRKVIKAEDAGFKCAFINRYGRSPSSDAERLSRISRHFFNAGRRYERRLKDCSSLEEAKRTAEKHLHAFTRAALTPDNFPTETKGGAA